MATGKLSQHTHGNLIGEQIAFRWRIESRLASGGMGTVFIARDSRTDAKVALKVFHPELTERMIERCVLEARIVGRLNNPRIPLIIDNGSTVVTVVTDASKQSPTKTEVPLHYMVSQFIEGQALFDMLHPSDGLCMPLVPSRALSILEQTIGIIAEVHANGVIHRDLKPENIQVTPRDQVYILDFGIAKILDERLTRTGETAGGTPFYMSPEQARGDDVDETTDTFALGAILAEVLTGDLPFKTSDSDGQNNWAPHFSRLMRGELDVPVDPPQTLIDATSPELAKRIWAVVCKALSHERKDRYTTAEAMYQDVHDCLLLLTDPSYIPGRMPTIPMGSQHAAPPPSAIDSGPISRLADGARNKPGGNGSADAKKHTMTPQVTTQPELKQRRRRTASTIALISAVAVLLSLMAFVGKRKLLSNGPQHQALHATVTPTTTHGPLPSTSVGMHPSPPPALQDAGSSTPLLVARDAGATAQNTVDASQDEALQTNARTRHRPTTPHGHHEDTGNSCRRGYVIGIDPESGAMGCVPRHR